MMFFFFFALFWFGLGIFLFVFSHIHSKQKSYRLETHISKNPKFGVLIPARNESKVIEELLKSIQNQTRKVSMSDVWVIVESETDPTISICNTYGVSVIIRHHLKLKSKGYALQEAIEYLNEKEIFYDAYFIFDADNVLDINYLKEMEQDYLHGYGISTGYRNLKNGDTVLPIAAGLTYTFINEWLNRRSMRKKQSIMLSGTGFYLHGNYIRQWGTYPFHSLTEDVELTHYATLSNISMHYNDKAIFYDEQPLTFSQSVVQRKRWIRGYFVNYFRMLPRYWKQRKSNLNHGSVYAMIFGILEVICIVLGIFSLLLFLLWNHFFLSIILLFLFLYLFLAFATLWILKKEKEKLNMDWSLKWKVIWYHPLFLLSYVYVFFLTLFERNISWEVVKHTEKKK